MSRIPGEDSDLKLELKIEPAADQAAVRLDRALLEILTAKIPTLSRAQLKAQFQQKRILLGSKRAQASMLLEAGTYQVTLSGFTTWAGELEDRPEAAASTQGCFLPVIYEDEDLFILQKRSGTPSVPHSPQETETAVGAALAHYPELRQVGRGGYEPGILHRLDTGTSGLLVFAKTPAEFERLRALWKEREVKKIYRAIVRPLTRTSENQNSSEEISPPLKSGMTIDTPLAHDAKSAKRMVALLPGRRTQTRGNPLPALTRIRQVTSIRDLCDVEIEIETGVMHQIRCHLSSLGWPIQGDPVYRGIPSSRLWLHAWKLEIPLKNGTRLRVESQLPDRWPRL